MNLKTPVRERNGRYRILMAANFTALLPKQGLERLIARRVILAALTHIVVSPRQTDIRTLWKRGTLESVRRMLYSRYRKQLLSTPSITLRIYPLFMLYVACIYRRQSPLLRIRLRHLCPHFNTISVARPRRDQEAGQEGPRNAAGDCGTEGCLCSSSNRSQCRSFMAVSGGNMIKCWRC